MNICVIPARAGSKRIPRKNIKEFNGKPIIAYSIEAALKSNCFSQVIVSTDDDEIANISRINGAETPFIRPKSLAKDDSKSIDVVKHAISDDHSKIIKDSPWTIIPDYVCKAFKIAKKILIALFLVIPNCFIMINDVFFT